MLDEETFFKCRWIIAKNEHSDPDKRGSQIYQSPMSSSILDLHARAYGIPKGLVAAKTENIVKWLKSINIPLLEVDKTLLSFDHDLLPDIGINWNEFDISPMADTVNSVYEFLYRHKDKQPVVFKGDFWYFEEIVDKKIQTEEDLRKGDVLVISCPFFGDFQSRSDMNTILKTCCDLDIPVLLDCVWLPLTYRIPKLENTDCIEMIVHSMTKTLPLAGIKGGLMWRRTPLSWREKTYPIGSKLGGWLFSKYMEDLGYWYVRDSLRPLQQKWCEILGLDITDMVYVGKCRPDTFIRKYTLHDRSSDLVSLVPFIENDDVLTKFLIDSRILTDIEI